MNEQGWMQWEIAATLGIANATVSRYLRKHNENVYNILAQDHAAERGRQARQLTIMYREAMDEWYRSKKDKGKVKVVEGVDGDGKKTHRTEREVQDSLGDPSYLDRAQNILAAIREILMMSKKSEVKDEAPIVGENDVTKALEKLNMMARELKKETGKAVREHIEGEGSVGLMPDPREDDYDDEDDNDDDEDE